MRRINLVLYLTAVLLTSLVSTPAATRYLDSMYTYTTTDVIYGQNVKYNGTVQDLKMRIYLPANDVLTKRPVIMWMHGGGFTQGNYLDSNCKIICDHFAERGYVTATVEYRLGVDQTNLLKLYDNFMDAVYRSIQDYRAAVRFLVKNADYYGIDPEMIIIGGASAGAVSSENYTYWDADEVGADIISRLGDFDASGNAGYSDAIAGAIPWAACVQSPDVVSPVDFPVIALHDKRDNTVPYGYGAALGIPLLMVYGDGYPEVGTNAGKTFHLTTFDYGDHIPTGSRHAMWVDTTRTYVYKLIIEPNLVPATQVATPVINPNGAVFTSTVQVSLACATDGAAIRYTTDGSTPSSSSILYTGPFILTATTTVKTAAFKTGLDDSPVAEAIFTYSQLGENLALGKTATASSHRNSTLAPRLAVDGDTTTRWSSDYADPQWLQVDLAGTYSVRTVVIKWTGAYGTDYTIETSENGTDWTTAFTRTGGTGGTEILTLEDSPHARYVRMNGTARATEWGYSVQEFEVYGGQVTGIAETQTATVPDLRVTVSANPVRDRAVFVISGATTATYLTVTDATGRVIFNAPIAGAIHELSLRGVSTGLCYYTVTDEKKQTAGTLMVLPH